MNGMAFYILAAALGSTSAPIMPDTYSSLCTGSKATGFNWENNDWNQANFKPDSYILSVSPQNTCFENFEKDVDVIAEVFLTRKVCMNIRDRTKDYNPKMSDVCSEYYVQDKSGKWEISFSCHGIFTGDIAGKFDGWFNKSILNSGFADVSKYKDSLVVEVGRCSRLI